MTPLDYVPVAVQACFAVGSLLKFRAVYKAGTANEQSVIGSTLAVAAHVTLGAWSAFYAHQPGMVVASVLGVAMTLPLLSLIVYRKLRVSE